MSTETGGVPVFKTQEGDDKVSWCYLENNKEVNVKFLKEIVRYAKDTAFYIKSESGHIILQGDTMNVNEDNSDNEDGISLLEKIVKIEDFFGVRLVRPDEV